jgi:hypothetical protein
MVPLTSSRAPAQIAVPTVITTEEDRFTNLQDQLLNRLRATREDQQAYIRFVIEQVRAGKVETKLVVAVERYAMRRNRDYPFPFFERALRYESAKRGVVLPPVEHFASSRVLPSPTGTTR